MRDLTEAHLLVYKYGLYSLYSAKLSPSHPHCQHVLKSIKSLILLDHLTNDLTIHTSLSPQHNCPSLAQWARMNKKQFDDQRLNDLEEQIKGYHKEFVSIRAVLFGMTQKLDLIVVQHGALLDMLGQLIKVKPRLNVVTTNSTLMPYPM